MPHADPEVRKAYLRDYWSRPENAARRREAQRKRWAENREQNNAKSRATYATRKDKHREAVYRWRANNREAVRAIERRYYRNRPTKRLQNQKVDQAYGAILVNDPCAYCETKHAEIVIDHITPRVRGGNGDAENLTAACRSCNARKRDRSLLTFLAA